MEFKRNPNVSFVGYSDVVSYRTDNFLCMVSAWPSKLGYEIKLESRLTRREKKISLDIQEVDLILRAVKKLGH